MRIPSGVGSPICRFGALAAAQLLEQHTEVGRSDAMAAPICASICFRRAGEVTSLCGLPTELECRGGTNWRSSRVSLPSPQPTSSARQQSRGMDSKIAV